MSDCAEAQTRDTVPSAAPTVSTHIVWLQSITLMRCTQPAGNDFYPIALHDALQIVQIGHLTRDGGVLAAAHVAVREKSARDSTAVVQSVALLKVAIAGYDVPLEGVEQARIGRQHLVSFPP